MPNNNSSMMTDNSHGLHFNYCFFLQVQETKTSVRGIPALLIGITNAVFSLVAVVGNALILAAIRRKSSLRTPFYILLAGLAATDLATGLITQPMYATYALVTFNQPDLFPYVAVTIYHTFDRGNRSFRPKGVSPEGVSPELKVGSPGIKGDSPELKVGSPGLSTFVEHDMKD